MEKLFRKNKMLGIFGISGIGKTTLVKAFKDYLNKISLMNDEPYSSFITVFWDLEKDHLKEMNRILKDLGNKQEANDLVEGKDLLSEKLQEKKVLLILEDVKNRDHLSKLISAKMFHMKGSKLIVTSRDWNILKGLIPEVGKMELLKLNEDQSLGVFLKHAFKDGHPSTPLLEQISIEIVKVCDGHPLSLEVIGSCLYGNERPRIWERALQRLKKKKFEDYGNMWTTLKVSYEALNLEEQQAFLDISWFFCKDVWSDSIEETSILHFWNGYFVNPKSIFTSLKDKSLIKVDYANVLSMHDLLRDIGRRISKESKDLKDMRQWKTLEGQNNDYQNEVGLQKLSKSS